MKWAGCGPATLKSVVLPLKTMPVTGQGTSAAGGVADAAVGHGDVTTSD